MTYAVIVDPYSSGNMFAAAFRRVGLEPVAVTSTPQPSDVYAASYRPQDFRTIITHRGDVPGTVAATRRLDPVCVVPGTECGVELADLIAPLVTPDRANVPELAAARRHKGAMREALVAADVPAVRQICTDSIEDAKAWVDREGLGGQDLIVKPPKSAGTDGVTLVRSGQDWQPTFRALLHNRNKLDLINDQVIVQEHLTGTEFVVDTFSHDGRHTVVDICRYRKQGTVYDSMDWMSYDLTAHGDLLDYTYAALDALGVRFGAAHSEVMLTSRGPILIETGVRLHGGGHPRICRIATGDSQIDRTVQHCIGATVPAGFTLQRHLRVVFLICRAAGIVSNLEAFDRVKALPSHQFTTLSVRNGDPVKVTHDLFTALGFVVLAHPDPSQVDADYTVIRSVERELIVDQP